MPALSFRFFPRSTRTTAGFRTAPDQKRPPPAVLQMIHTVQDTADKRDEAGMARMLELTTALARKLAGP
jgi:hypothetical protein